MLTEENRAEGLKILESFEQMTKIISDDAGIMTLEIEALGALAQKISDKITDGCGSRPLAVSWAWEEKRGRYTAIITELAHLMTQRTELLKSQQEIVAEALRELGFEDDDWPEILTGIE